MSDRLLDKYASRNGTLGIQTGEIPDVDDAGMDDLGTFGFVRGSRERAVCLEMRLKTGNIIAIGYSWIERMEFDPSEGIILHAFGQKIQIKGRNLNKEIRQSIRLFEGIVRQKVPWILESDESAHLSIKDNATVIDSIKW